MKQDLLLPWFPILLGVGIGGRLLGQARGFGLGILAAMFWIVLVQAGSGVGIWRDPWQVLALVCGASVLVTMGGWSGQSHGKDHQGSAARKRADNDGARPIEDLEAGWRRITAATAQFDDWLARHGNDRHAWAEFGECIRGVLYECCQATHVKCFRLIEATRELQCLDRGDDIAQSIGVSAGRGVIAKVFANGRSFLADDSDDADAASGPCDGENRNVSWCFPIEKGASRVGVVAIGQIGVNRPSRAFMTAIERLVALFWLHLTEVNLNRIAGDEDSVSGLLNRQTFLRTADEALRESYDQGEPVALAIVGVQGLRQLNDSGRWEVADELVHEIGLALRAKARMDDRIGRFDGSRFVWLLRRVDAELAGLILKHVATRLEQICGDQRWGVSAAVYCGLTGSGPAKPDLRRLVTTALQQSHSARERRLPMATDLKLPVTADPLVVAGAGAQ